jgi:hypothetical protein
MRALFGSVRFPVQIRAPRYQEPGRVTQTAHAPCPTRPGEVPGSNPQLLRHRRSSPLGWLADVRKSSQAATRSAAALCAAHRRWAPSRGASRG